MKRDMEFVRSFLLHIEKSHDGYRPLMLKYDDFPETKPEQVYHHLQILTDGGFLKRQNQSAPNMPATLGLTWSGHEFLNTIRDEKVWRETKNAISGLASTSLEVVKQVATAAAVKIALGTLT